jgi:HSP20 family protein
MDTPQGLVKIDDLLYWQSKISPENFIEPQTNIYVVNDKFVVVSNLPGVPRENIKIEISDNELSFMGRAPGNFEIAACDFYIKEFRLGAYYRKFILSDNIDIENIDAKFENGQLTIILPRRKKCEKHEIIIKQ